MKQSVQSVRAFIVSAMLVVAGAVQADYYWDINGNSAGAGGVSPNGIWDGSNPAATNWNTSSSGSGGTINNLTTSGDTVHFSAGTDATGSFTVKVVNTQQTSGLLADYGSVNLSGGVVSNVWISVGTAAGKVALLSVSDGCQLLITAGGGRCLFVGTAAGANSNGVYVGSTTGTNSILSTSPNNNVQIGCGVNTGNWVKVDQGGLLTAQQQVLIGSANNSVGNFLIITNGGQCSGSTVQIGAYTGGNSNWVYVGSTTGTNSTLSATTSDVNIGGGASTGNRVTVDRGGLLTAGQYFKIGDAANSVGNSLIIKKGGQIIAGSQGVNIGNNATANNNGVTVADGGIMTNMPWINLGSKGNGNYLVVTNGGQVSTKDMLYLGASAGANSNWVYVGSTTGTNSLLSLSQYDLEIGCAANTGNRVMVDQGGVMNVNRYLLVGYGANAVGNYMIITNGGLVVSLDSYVGGWNGGASSNFVVIASSTASNSVWNLVNKPLYIGNNAGENGNYMNVFGGGMATNISTLTVGGNATASGNYFNLSGGGLLEINTGITMGTGPGSNNTLTNQGGILQFTTLTPSITTNAGGNVIVMNGGTLGYRNVSNVNITNNWILSDNLRKMLWQGNNSLRLDNASGNNALATPYIFAAGQPQGTYNYVGLSLVNGSPAFRGKGATFGATTGDNSGSLLVANVTGTATFDGVVTNYSANVILASINNLVASNGIVWMSGSASTTTVGTASFDVRTTNSLNSGTVTFNQSAGATQIVNGVVTGSGGLLKSGPGVLILAGNNSYAGATTVGNGTLLVNGSVNGSVTVAGGATLGGTGTVYGSFTNSGVYSYAITNSTGGGASLLNVSGNVVLQPGSTLSLTGTNNLASSSAVYTLIKATGTVSGTFDNDKVVLPKGWRVSYAGNSVRVVPGYLGTLIRVL